MLLAKRESVDRERQDLLWRKNELERRKRIEALLLADVVWPRQSANRGLFHVVLEDFREKQFALNQRAAKVNAWRRLRDADHGIVFAKNGRHEILDIVVPLLLRRFGLNGRQSARETSKSCVIGRFVDRERLHRIRGNGNGKASRHRIGRLRGIHQKQALIFVSTLERELSVLRFYHSRSNGNYFPDLFLRRRQSNQFAVGYSSLWVGNALRGDDLRLFLDLNFLRDRFEFQAEILHHYLPGRQRDRF